MMSRTAVAIGRLLVMAGMLLIDCIVDLPTDQASRLFPLVFASLCYWP